MKTHAASTQSEGRRATSLADFCSERSLSLRTGWSLVSSGALKVGRVGRRVLVFVEDAAAFDEAARSGALAS